MFERIIEISLDNKQMKDYSIVEKELNKSLSDNGVIMSLEKDILKITLSNVDVNKLKILNQKLEKKYKIKKKNNILIDIINKIDSVGSYGIKGGKRVYNNFNSERKVLNRKKKVEKRVIHYYANNNNFSKENVDFPAEFLDKIVCADSEKFLKKLPNNCVDLIFTSPPYNFGLNYSSTNDDFFWETYFKKLFLIFDECIRVLKWGGRIIINVQPLFSDYIPSHHIISNYFINKKLIWKGEILWEKNNYNCKYTAWGSWKSPSSPYLKYTWEFIEIFCKGSLKKDGSNDKIDISAEEFKKWVVAKWSIAPERKMKDLGHPAMFPTSLVERILKLFSFEKDLVLDPFNGAGTTTLVAKRLNRHYLGLDVSKDYTNKAKNRLKDNLI
jgi:DNA modification methylase